MAATEAQGMSRYIRDRLAFMKALKSAPSAPKKGECQYAPAMDVLGVYISHIAVTRMVARGELPLEVGAFFNSVLGRVAFAAMHGCSHGSISQQNPEHETLENSVFRLSALVLWANDGFVEYHKRHHNRTNTDEDPDIWTTRLPLSMMGYYLSMAQAGANGEGPAASEITEEERQGAQFHWDNQVLRLASLEAIKVLTESGSADMANLGRTLEATWRRAADMGGFLGAVFFARYPHFNCVTGQENEVDSFFDTTNRGQAEVDLWMMGEGFHHAHHAKVDIPATRLARVGLEVEERHPEIKAQSRGCGGLLDVMDGRLCETLGPEEPPPDQGAWRRTCRVEMHTDQLFTDVEGGVVGITEAVLDHAIEVGTRVSFALLRSLHSRMILDRLVTRRPVPMGTWDQTMWSEATQETLRAEAPRIKEKVLAAAKEVAAEFTSARVGAPPLARREDIKASYLDFFEAVARAFVGRADALRFLDLLVGKLPAPEGAIASDALRRHMEMPVPKDIIKMVRNPPGLEKGTAEACRQRIAGLAASVRSRL